MTELKQSLEENVILMIVSNQDKINLLRQVLVRVSRDVTLVRIAKHRIKENAYAGGLDQDASMPEVAPPDACSFVLAIRRRLVPRQKRFQESIVFVSHSQCSLDRAEAIRLALKPE